MEVREGCNVSGESRMGHDRGGCTGEYNSGSHCQRLRAGGDFQHLQVRRVSSLLEANRNWGYCKMKSLGFNGESYISVFWVEDRHQAFARHQN